MEGSLVVGVIVIGFVHGVLPDHGWPIAATYALGHSRRFLHGLVAGVVLGVGHLVSSVALVLAYFWISGFTAFAESPWMGYVAGTLLILLGIREYRHGSHAEINGHGHGHERVYRDVDVEGIPNGGEDGHVDDHHHHGHDDYSGEHRHGNEHEHGSGQGGGHHGDQKRGDSSLYARIRGVLPGGGHAHLEEKHAQQGLFTLGSTALLLGFAHEEPIQILAICVGTDFCLELMLVYSLAVIVAITLPTLALIAGYERHRETVERYTPYLPTITAIVLVAMGLAFVTGLI